MPLDLQAVQDQLAQLVQSDQQDLAYVAQELVPDLLPAVLQAQLVLAQVPVRLAQLAHLVLVPQVRLVLVFGYLEPCLFYSMIYYVVYISSIPRKAKTAVW